MATVDNLAPVLTGLTFPFVSVTDGAASFRFDATAVDQGSGVARVQLTLDHPLMSGGGALSTITFGSWNGGASSWLTLPIDASSYAGPYQIVQAVVTDAASNVTTYTASGLQAVGIASSFTVYSRTPTDTAAPELLSIIAQPSINAGGAGTVAFSVGAQDFGTGVRQVTIHLDHALQTDRGALDTLVFSDAMDSFGDGVSSLTQTLTSATAAGRYEFTSVEVQDKAGNITNYDSVSLYNLSVGRPAVATAFVVQDNTPPVITSFSLPSSIDVIHDNASAMFSATATDASGIQQILLTLDHAVNVDLGWQRGPFHSPSTHEYLNTTAINLIGISYSTSQNSFSKAGDTYTVTTPLSPRTPPGTYHVVSAEVTDNSGLVSTYNEAALAHLGNTTFAVIADDTAPVLRTLDLPDTVSAGNYLGFRFTVAAMDEGSGLGSVSVRFDKSVSNRYAIDDPHNHTIESGGYGMPDITGNEVMLSSAAVTAGTYTITGLTLTDKAGNAANYTADQLHALGFDTDVIVGHPASEDFNSDLRSDVLWLNQNGAVSTWSGSQSGSLVQSTYNAQVAIGWNAVETFDWNGDNRSDILWRHDNGSISIWNGSADGFSQASYNDQVGNEWKIVAAADFNGDGKGDILWQHQDGSLSDWLSGGDGFAKNVWSHGPVGGGWQVAGSADFSGDGFNGIVWRNTDGAVSIWYAGYNYDAAGNNFWGFIERGILDRVSSQWHIVGLSDFTGDGKADILWRHDDGSVSVWGSTGGIAFNQSLMNAYAAPGWNVAQVGDFNGDMMSDILWRNTNGSVSIWESNGTGWNQNTYSDSSVGNDWRIAAHDFPL